MVGLPIRILLFYSFMLLIQLADPIVTHGRVELWYGPIHFVLQ